MTPQDDPTGKEKRQLRQLGRRLSPLLQLSEDGLTSGAAETIDHHLRKSSLVKVRIASSTGRERKDRAQRLSEQLDAACVDVVGRSVLLYRPGEEDPLRPDESDPDQAAPQG